MGFHGVWPGCASDGCTASLNSDLTTGINSPTNYAGETGSVDVYAPPTCTNVGDCSGHGTCIAIDTCSCDAGWDGADSTIEVVVPTISTWGVAVFALLIVVAGSVLATRRLASIS